MSTLGRFIGVHQWRWPGPKGSGDTPATS